MADELIQHVIETADEAKLHRYELEELLSDLKEAKSQVCDSSVKSKQRITDHFALLRECIAKALATRENELLQEVSDLENAALEPLAGCEQILHKEIEKADGILAEGKVLLSGDVDSPQSAVDMLAFKTRVSSLDLNSLPEVPSLQEVACIHVDLPRDGSDIECQLVEAIEDYGHVLGRAPVQIVELQQRAGAVLIKWAEMQCEDQETEINEFNLRYCVGDLQQSADIADFTDSYKGHGMLTTVRGLAAGVTYSFQVCGRSQSDDNWSPWSIPMTTTTIIPHYAWQSTMCGYEVSDEGRALATIPGSTRPVMCSSGSTFQCGHSIIFRVQKCGDPCEADAIGLCLHGSPADLKQKGVLFVSSDGRVFVDGQEKTTRLPQLKPGSMVSFDTEVLTSNKLRVTAEIDDKILTLDWSIENATPHGTPMPMMSQPDTNYLYFFARFENYDWKLCVE